MKLSSAQEECFLARYDKLIWKIVHEFRARNCHGYDNKEDLHSECVIVLIKHIRKSQSFDELMRIPVRDMINAMCCYFLSEQTVSYPKRTANFREVMDNVPAKVNYDVIDIERRVPDKRYVEDAVEMIAIQQFINGLEKPLDKRIIEMKLNGARNRDIAKALHISDTVITRTLQRLKKLYDEQQYVA